MEEAGDQVGFFGSKVGVGLRAHGARGATAVILSPLPCHRSLLRLAAQCCACWPASSLLLTWTVSPSPAIHSIRAD